MKFNLPLLIKVFAFSILLLIFTGFSRPVQATEPPTPTPDIRTGWVKDQEVTFVGKSATRANEFLQWTLSEENYRWITLPAGGQNPIQDFWGIVRNIVFVLLALFVLGAAFVMIITRGQNLTVMRFIPRFIMIVVLVVLSFALIRFLYQATDVVQGFFLNIDDPVQNTERNIGPQDLLYVAFDYPNFIGYRKTGIEFDESAFISLLLVKLTAVTYYVMTGLLLIRKIILWFFIIVSPIFPLLIFFRPVRNTAKIWVGEFFRWLLYAPLFALFLHGLVKVWRSGIPMSFDFTNVGQEWYPTAINILLGGPGQRLDYYNSVNIRDTFALYVVALLMLWVVILLPFLLLQIFLDYLSNISLSDNTVVKKITSNSWFNKAYGGTPPAPGQPPQSPAPFGLAKNIPFIAKRAMQLPLGRNATATREREIEKKAASMFSTSARTLERASTTNLESVRETRDVLRQANLTIPKMRDIARYETSMMKKDTVSRSEVSRFHETLEKISTPTIAATPVDRDRFTTIKEKLILSQKQGDPLASSVMNATTIINKTGQPASVSKEKVTEILTQIANPSSITETTTREKITTIKEQLVQEQQKGDSLATSIISTSQQMNNTTVSKEQKETMVEKVIEKLHEEAKKNNQLAINIVTQAGSSDFELQVSNILSQIANPDTVPDEIQKEKITEIKEKLVIEQQKGDPLATSILSTSEQITNSSVTKEQKETMVEKVIEKLHEEAKRNNELAVNIVTQAGSQEFERTVIGLLKQIANPEAIPDQAQKEKVTEIKEKLVQQKAKGDTFATTILETSEKVNSTSVSTQEKKTLVERTIEKLHEEAKHGNQIARDIVSTRKTSEVSLPAVNKVQQVSIEEYEDVKKMWQENYQNMETPVGPNGVPMDKHSFIQQDIDNITETINLLSSPEQPNVDKGMQRVANILPFLLLGGFSKTEVVSYLKAKLEAGKTVMTGVDTKKEDEDTLLERRDKTQAAQAQMVMHQDLPVEEKPVDPASVASPIATKPEIPAAENTQENGNPLQPSPIENKPENEGENNGNGGTGAPPGINR